ncbi:MAG: 4Fe-4S dicluster domain-containing protein [Gracilibacteraceae bacterium]|jgi:NAD-dependent dihydropyrimidine dehydrogenase PreA subunit|nr:4Fe-4S dicluster domain-containing protein [Gracilibacteraceae bacterium]
MYIVSIDDDQCSGCDSCADGCPARILSFDRSRGKAYVSGDEAECMGCEACVAVCPGGAIIITEM